MNSDSNKTRELAKPGGNCGEFAGLLLQWSYKGWIPCGANLSQFIDTCTRIKSNIYWSK
jgi:hypothetical protein